MRKIKGIKIIMAVILLAIIVITGYSGVCDSLLNLTKDDSGSSTPTPPVIIIGPTATDITTNSATFNATVNPNGPNTYAHFDYHYTYLDTFLGYKVPSDPVITTSQNIGSGTTDVAISATVSSLSPSTLYYFAVVAINASGTTRAEAAFTTASDSSPTCTTNNADSITTNSARLNATVNPNGYDTYAYFNYGLTTSYGNTTNSQAIGSGNTGLWVTADISGLSSNTLYNFRVVGSNAMGTTYGYNLTFTTAP